MREAEEALIRPVGHLLSREGAREKAMKLMGFSRLSLQMGEGAQRADEGLYGVTGSNIVYTSRDSKSMRGSMDT